jgi:DNA-binding transcriptional ArsR family regulator
MSAGAVVRRRCAGKIGLACPWTPPGPGSIFTHMGEYQTDRLDRVLSAVADPTRRGILARLASGQQRVTDVAREFPMSLNSVSKHVRVLEQAGLVERTVRGREHMLALNAEPIAGIADWVEQYRSFWTDRLAALDAFATGAVPITSSTSTETDSTINTHMKEK